MHFTDFDLVSAHLPDRIGTVIIGELMPYDDSKGERVRDSEGTIWNVVSDSVRLVQARVDSDDGQSCNCQAIPGTPNYPGPWHERGGEPHYPCTKES